MSNTDISGVYAITQTFKAVHYGPGSLTTALPKLLEEFGARKAFIITGRTLATKTNIVRKVESVLTQGCGNAWAGTFSEIGEHSPVAGVEAGLRALNEAGAVDVVISVGGGSPIDAAKAIVLKHRERTRATTNAKTPALPMIAIPTTLSAAEYTAAAGTTNEEGHKSGVRDPELAPAGIILDSELTLDTPERLWLSSGMRALDHAIESFYNGTTPYPLKHLSLAAIHDLFTYLPACKADPSAIIPRQRLQVAAWMSLWPISAQPSADGGGHSLSHALGHKLGATYKIPHGMTSCLTLAPVVALQTTLSSPEEKSWLARALLETGATSTGSVDGDVRALSTEIDKLVRALGLHTDLAAFGVPRADVPTIVSRTLGELGGRTQYDENGVEKDLRYDAVVRLLDGLYPSSNQ